MRRKFSGIINVAFNEKGRLLILHSSSNKYLKKSGNTINQFISSL